MNKIKNYFKGVGIEARRVRWPHKKKLWKAVATVCIIAIIAALLIFFEDWITIQILQAFEDVFPSSEASSSASESATSALMAMIG